MEGKSWGYCEQKATEEFHWSPYEALIDLSDIIGEVEEIPFYQYKEETKHCCIELGGLI